LGEDCLTLNIVRPSMTNSSSDEKLPVGVFIHGGGWTMDFSANGVYNMSFMVEQSVKVGKPMIGVSVDCESTYPTNRNS
jgi:carboxylesterase type B